MTSRKSAVGRWVDGVFGRGRPKSRPAARPRARLGLTQFESRLVPATINWANETTSGFSPAAKAIVNQAIDDWERVIANFNYTNVGSPGYAPAANTFTVDISQSDLVTSGLRGQTDPYVDMAGKPVYAIIQIDDDAGGYSWYYDTVPQDNAEFTSLTTAFMAQAAGTGSDFYRTVAHELGHAMGVYSHFSTSAAPNDLMNEGNTIPDNTPIRQLISNYDATYLQNTYGYTVNLPSTLETFLVNPNASTGEVRVNADPQVPNNNYYVQQSGSNITLTVNGVAKTLPASAVTSVAVVGRSGDDTVNVYSSLTKPVYVDGGAGTNKVWLQGTGGNDAFAAGASGSVSMNGSVVYPAAGVTQVVMAGYGGDDNLIVQDGLTVPALFDGGAGADTDSVFLVGDAGGNPAVTQADVFYATGNSVSMNSGAAVAVYNATGVTAYGYNGNDALVVNAGISVQLGFLGGAGVDNATFIGSSGNDDYFAGRYSVGRAISSTASETVYFSNGDVEGVTIKGMAGNDSASITPSAATGFKFIGGDNPLTEADYLYVTEPNPPRTYTYYGSGDHDGYIAYSPTFQNVEFENIDN